MVSSDVLQEKEATHLAANAIQTHELTHRFGPVVAVDRLNLEVPIGSIYAFLGPNGAGKTTTIRALLGLIRPASGEVQLFGQSLGQHRRALLKRVGALVETPSLYPHLTGYENLDIKRRLVGGKPSEIVRVLDLVDMTQDASRLVGGYSLGMQQRLGLAKALLGQPDVLILDEPTNGLDPAGIRELRQLIRRLPDEHGITVFVSSHLLGEVEQVATHVGIIGRGHMLFEGTPGELRGRTGEQLNVEVDHPEMAREILARAGWLAELDGAVGLAIRVDSRAAAPAVNAVLVRAGLSAYQLQIRQRSLEELFLELTAVAELGSRAA